MFLSYQILRFFLTVATIVFMEKEKIILPKAFTKEMKEILGDELENFIESYDNLPYTGLRRNPLKSSKEHFEATMPFNLTPVSWATEGYYYDAEDRPGRTVLHEAGAFYIQEPSAMSAVSLLAPLPGDFVLDLCAAPGGKSTQIAGRLQGKGLLVSNEIIKDRAKILSSNIERLGVRNACVLNETPEKLSTIFNRFFDKILVDAPCSGEGMFKKEPNALIEWSPENVIKCHERQLSILDDAASMLKPGGVLVYSTCTFNTLENEKTIEEFLKSHPEFTIEKSLRIWPHKDKGEGHFAARLIKSGESETTLKLQVSNSKIKLNDLKDFLEKEVGIKKEAACDLFKDRIISEFGENIYLTSAFLPKLSGLKVERAGLLVAESKKNRFEPSHSLALSLNPEDVTQSYELSDEEALRYIKGETIACEPSLKGWVLMSVKGFSIGFGKASNGIIKNHYPKGLRK
jgi:16S rRNA C967 or C1407 C5-methylase (RsmB/RsmF family)/NOL1/NOP2/fmu family ribosome biogenesis protein